MPDKNVESASNLSIGKQVSGGIVSLFLHATSSYAVLHGRKYLIFQGVTHICTQCMRYEGTHMPLFSFLFLFKRLTLTEMEEFQFLVPGDEAARFKLYLRL